MPVIKISGFSGEQPRVLPRLIPDNAAQSAINTRLDDGGLTPLRRSAQVAAADSGDWQTIVRYNDDWLGWTGVVHAAPGPVAQDRLYFTGDGVPKVRIEDDVYPLAVPVPASALTATLGGTGSGDVATRVYVFTWVTEFDEESEPSPVSNELNWQPGNTVTLSGFPTAPADRGINRQRIYRSQTGQSGTYFYFIAERAASTANFVDNIAVDAFQEPLPSATWNPPPNDLQGLIALPNGMMAAFAGRDLYFCEPWRPHAWPEKYVLTVDAPIVGLGAIGTSIAVLTTKQPYWVAGSTPDSMVMQKLEHNLPCINARGIVDLGYSIAYPSHEGLVVIGGDGGFRLATGNIFNRIGWKRLSPETMIGSQFAGRYVAFYQTAPGSEETAGMLMIDVQEQSFLVRAADRATAAWFDTAESALYYLAEATTDIFRFDAPAAGLRQQYWKSKQFVLPYAENFGALRVDADATAELQSPDSIAEETAAVLAANTARMAAGPLNGDIDGAMLDVFQIDGDPLEALPNTSVSAQVGVFADGVRVATVTDINRAVRLPSGFRARTWELDVFGNIQVAQVVMAKTIDELKATP